MSKNKPRAAKRTEAPHLLDEAVASASLDEDTGGAHTRRGPVLEGDTSTLASEIATHRLETVEFPDASDQSFWDRAVVAHQACLDAWDRKPPGAIFTQHGMDAHLPTGHPARTHGG